MWLERPVFVAGTITEADIGNFFHEGNSRIIHKIKSAAVIRLGELILGRQAVECVGIVRVQIPECSPMESPTI